MPAKPALSLLVVLAACSSSPSTTPEVVKPAAAPETVPPPEPALAPVRLVSTGYMHQCCVTDDNRAVCNGSNKHAEITVPDIKFSQVSAGLYATCAIDLDKKPHCWGEYAPPLDSRPAVDVERIAVGSKFACAVTSSRELVCWSEGDFPEAPAGSYVDVVAGWEHACALSDKGAVKCFGRAQREPMVCAELEDADGSRCEEHGQGEVPRSWTEAPADLRAVAIGAGSSHSCAVTTEGKVACWGSWGHGDGNTIFSHQIFPPEGLGDVRKITGGGGSSCALHADGTARCWGDQKDLPGVFVDIDGGASGTCGIRKDGAMECFTYSSFAGAKLDTSPLRCATSAR